MCLAKCKPYVWDNQIIFVNKNYGIVYYLFLSYSLGLFSLTDHVHTQSLRGQDRICAKLAPRHPAVPVLYKATYTHHDCRDIKIFIWNKISLNDVLELFDVYSNLSSQCEDLIHNYFEIWSRNMKQKQMSIYYNMRIGRMVYGSDLDQLELFDVDPNEIKIGFGDFFPDFVRDRILRKRSGE